MTILESIAKPATIQGIVEQGMPFGIAMGFKHPNGTYQITHAFGVNERNWGKILDVIARFAMMGLYDIGSKEIQLLPKTLHSNLMKWFEYTDHGKMKEFLALLQEKQKGGSIGIFAVIVTPDHIADNNAFSVRALYELEK